ncbi:50S ribosomal protein L9 [Enterorhabdus sp. P55]|jgi:large subunit ribosomal protein L9|uniref:50S ribosomal protein L9 n=1 Tax=Enterorhabdus sp. P55 TaxID=2304571 RepID=UPI001370840C|nr:50S ribosomal protein L9 [Enterorhabdus sp. P55]MCI8452288.1 50S ribosomal protein L9 [Eggerthellaceae bacterium]NBI33238.1 50S ribosomal protein L9 [Enterorhabdus sp. P55]
MKVILLKELKGKGGEGDVIDVARGFANNYLLTQGYAVLATKGNLKQLEQRKHNIAKREETRIANAEALKAKLDDLKVTVDAQVGEEGQLFGSVTSVMVADAIQAAVDAEIDKRRVELGKPIKVAGVHPVTVSLYRDIKATVQVVVGREDAEAEDAIDALEEAIDIAESPADEMVEIDAQVSEDGTVEAEVTEVEE